MSLKIDGLITHWVIVWEVSVEVTLQELAIKDQGWVETWVRSVK